jgi:hypothetical protein
MKLVALDRIKPSAAEVSANPRSRSAVMRVAERTEVPVSMDAAGCKPGSRRMPGSYFVLLLAVIASALYLVHTQYASRRLFTELDRAIA